MGYIVLSDEGGELTFSGEHFLRTFGADLSPRPGSRRIFCQPCLDWTERRYHLKGLVGAAILRRLLELGWFKRIPGSRALRLTPSGRAGLFEAFHVEFDEQRQSPGSFEAVLLSQGSTTSRGAAAQICERCFKSSRKHRPDG